MTKKSAKKPTKKKPIHTATVKQERLIKIIQENLTAKKPKTLEKMLLEAGYSETRAKKPKAVIQSKGVQEGLRDTMAEVKRVKHFAIKNITNEKLKKVHPRDLAQIATNMEKIDLSENVRIQTEKNNGEGLNISIDL